MNNLIDGKKIALEILHDLEKKIAKTHRKPGLAFILVGENPASQTYVRQKKKTCAQIGILSTLIELPNHTSQEEVIQHIDRLNNDPAIDGILVQLPLPLHIHDRAIMLRIDPTKDVDGFHPLNMGKLLLGEEGGFFPCTPAGILELLTRYQIPTAGKHVVIVGRSNIVGKPLAALMMQKKCNATVTIAHSHTRNLISITQSADILVVATGQPHFIKKEMIREGTVVIDVGINRFHTGKLVGDVDFDEVAPISSWITPVPGGVGPMTIAMLMKNTYLSYLQSKSI
ncbi:MAG TPA: bifunctional methylenetetrahydrofolate dehydrogenase/methenyltetrahydrofolate cyclohydrolase FolD [Chlamydiales bacterium]|nr:bifunctional methylenetetrahydrofolate dehydrogenase/methenyltetrahydrofolate cyclohydrolase FolD [Chlamydiales bacterium]